MKEVKAYQCSDGSVKTNKLEALTWERTLVIRGILQSEGMIRDGSMTPTTAASLIVNNFEEIRKAVDSFNRKIKNASKVA